MSTWETRGKFHLLPRSDFLVETRRSVLEDGDAVRVVGVLPKAETDLVVLVTRSSEI